MSALEDRDLRVLRRLVSEHYHAPRTLERLISARTEQVTETVVEDEPYTETYEVETGQCTDNKVICVLRWLQWAALFGIKVAFVLPLAAVGLLASEDVDEADDSDGSGDGNGRLSVPKRAGLLWNRFKQEFRERTTGTEIRHETRTLKVEREVTREVEIELERTVRETESSSRRIVSLGRGRLAFHASSTPVGTIVTGPQGLMSHVTTRFPVPRDFEGVYRADEGIRQALDRVPWALSGEPQHHRVPGDDFGLRWNIAAPRTRARAHGPLRGDARVALGPGARPHGGQLRRRRRADISAVSGSRYTVHRRFNRRGPWRCN